MSTSEPTHGAARRRSAAVSREALARAVVVVLALTAAARAQEASDVRVIALQPGGEGADPRDLVLVGERLFFSAGDGAGGRRLFVSDGSVGGTRALGPSGDPQFLTRHAGALWFSLDDGVAGRELWRSDGSDVGTARVLDLDPGAGSGAPRNLVSLRGVLAFDASDGVRGRELWITDGSTEGTVCVSDPDGLAGSGVSAVLGASARTVWYLAPGGSGPSRIGVSDLTPDGTGAGTGLPGLQPIVLRSAVAHDTLFVVTHDTVDGRTTPLTRVAADAADAAYVAQTVQELANVAGRLFVARHTPRVLSSRTPPGPTEGVELFVTTPDGAGIARVLDRGDETLIANPGAFGAVRRDLYFALTSGDEGREPWISDGTSEGTRPVAALRPGTEGSFPTAFRPLGIASRAVFSADDGVHGREPWITDGTAAGTRLLADLAAGGAGSSPTSMLVGAGALFVVADTGDGPRLLAVPLRDIDVDRTLLERDGDGFPDEIERFAGSDEHDLASTPGDAAAVESAATLELQHVKVRLRFDRVARDQVRVAGRVALAGDLALDGAPVLVDVGGLVTAFDLDARGRGTNAAGDRIRVRVPRRRGSLGADLRARFTLRFARGDHAPALADEGLVAQPEAQTGPQLAVFVVLGDRAHEARTPLRWRTTQRAGSARLPR